MGALGALLGVDAWLVGSPGATPALYIVPPLLVLGAALASGLLARSSRSVVPLYGALLLTIPGVALIFAQQALLGPTLVPLDLPGSRWVRVGTEVAARVRFLNDPRAFLLPGQTLAGLWERATLGLAVLSCGLMLVALALTRTRTHGAKTLLDQTTESAGAAVLDAVRLCAAITAALATLLLANQPRVLPAVLVVAAGLFLFIPPAMRAHPGVNAFFALGVLLLVHAVAHLGANVPPWGGPVLALAGLLFAGVRGGRRSGKFLFGAGLAYALATGGATDRESALIGLAASFGTGVVGAWLQSLSLPATLALIAGGSLGSAATANAVAPERAAQKAAGAVAVLALAATTALLVVWPQFGLPGGRAIATALLYSGLAAVAQLGLWSPLGRRLPHAARGIGWGRDGLLIFAGILTTVVLRGPRGGAPIVLPLGLATLLLGAMVAAHAAYCERTARHIYLVQIALVGFYALLRTQVATSLGPPADACFALCLGFLLVGVTTVARRADIPPLAQATRRFAALLPVGLALLLPSGPSGQTALMAGGASLLYTTLAVVERSRLFGALGALAVNVALLLSALAWDVRGSEIYLAPLGLLILMLAQIFGRTVSSGSRHLLQAIGGLFIYLPTAFEMAQRLGAPDSGSYAVGFGALCLLGVVAGMVLRIRSYLIMATLFLSLDVAVNLVNIGLRDHRVGFWLLSLSGLGILGAMVGTTLRPEQLQHLAARLRRHWRAWD